MAHSGTAAILLLVLPLSRRYILGLLKGKESSTSHARNVDRICGSFDTVSIGLWARRKKQVTAWWNWKQGQLSAPRSLYINAGTP
ncbi:hypothetical protein K439DRAFT_281547 [Ramaria rubella]|nr:hypothetical protein K439DRAFT_281547 [Ramaria rubella]